MQAPPGLPYESKVICSGSQTSFSGAGPRAARGQKPPRELAVQPGLLGNAACAQRENSRLNSAAIFFVPRRPRPDCVYGTRAGMPINALSGSFTQLLTFLSVAREGVVGSSSVVTGFIKPSDVFQPRPRLDTEVKRRERSTREERAGCRRSARDQPRETRRRPKAVAVGAAAWRAEGRGCASSSSSRSPGPKLRVSPVCLGKCPRLCPAG